MMMMRERREFIRRLAELGCRVVGMGMGGGRSCIALREREEGGGFSKL